MPEAAASQAAALAPQAVPAPSAAASERARPGDLPRRPGAAASDGRTSATAIEKTPSASVAAPDRDMANDVPVAGDAQAAAPSVPGSSQPAGSPAIAFLGLAALIVGLVLVVLRLGAKRLA